MSAIKSPVRLHRWTFYEERALVEFVGLASMDAKYGLSTSECIWPAFRPGHTFWADAAKHIQASTCSCCGSLLCLFSWFKRYFPLLVVYY